MTTTKTTKQVHKHKDSRFVSDSITEKEERVCVIAARSSRKIRVKVLIGSIRGGLFDAGVAFSDW